ncbi:MAG TPA: hypothetical protein VMG31_01705 [Verrucomicrobiae bacterium]|nr:hypothetical protein [Verrucomicrobiae bacterium]
MITTAPYPGTLESRHGEYRGPDALFEKASRVPDPIRVAALALCIYATLRILFFTLAFPLFNNLDEKLHFLTIQMYAKGHFPGKELPRIDREFVGEFLPYWSPEYMGDARFMSQEAGVPLYQLSPQAYNALIDHGYWAWKVEDLQHRLNFEAQGAPLYYLIAGAWYDLGTTLGFGGWRLAFWLRLINPISYGLLVWLSFLFVRKVYPERQFLQVAVPGLIAVFPQDVFFGMNRDVLPPTLWAAALLFMADAVFGEDHRPRFLIAASLLVGLSFLLEVSNCVLYGALAASIWIWLRHSQVPPKRKRWVLSGCVVAAFLPPSLWMLRNYRVIGDLTGSKAKIQNFGWTVKPLMQMWHHPIFSWSGFSFFVVKLTRSVWHGDYDWHGLPMRSATADWFYVLSSGLMILIFVADFLRRRRSPPDSQRWAGWQSLWLVGGSVLFILAVSMMFDYHKHLYPSQVHPFFVSGRIISGALLPFALIYASGLEWVTGHFRKRIPPLAVLACLLLLITASELRVRRPVISSPYNFFALSRWQR